MRFPGRSIGSTWLIIQVKKCMGHYSPQNGKLIYCYFYISYIEFHPCYFGGENSNVSYHIIYHSITQVSYYVNGLNDHFHVRCDPWVFYRNIILCHNVPAMHLVNSLSRVTHTCFSKLGHHCFRWWLVACSTPSHHLNQCWNTDNWLLRNKSKWNLNRNPCIFFQENASGTFVWK